MCTNQEHCKARMFLFFVHGGMVSSSGKSDGGFSEGGVFK